MKFTTMIRFRVSETELSAAAFAASVMRAIRGGRKRNVSEMLRELLAAEMLSQLSQYNPPYPVFLLKNAPLGVIADAYLNWIAAITDKPHTVSHDRYEIREMRTDDGNVYGFPFKVASVVETAVQDEDLDVSDEAPANDAVEGPQ
jgi:hypothetical protein